MAMRGIARHRQRRPKALICRSFCHPWAASEGVSKPCRYSVSPAACFLPDTAQGQSLWVIIIKIWYETSALKKLPAVLVLCLIAAGLPLPAAAQVEQDLQRCRENRDPFRRLICYDDIVDAIFGPPAGGSRFGSGGSHPDAIVEYAGDGQMLTPPFSISGPWEVRWQSDGKQFQIFLSDSLGNFIQILAEQQGGGQGISAVPQAGTYTLNINADGPWSLAIVPTSQ